MIYSLKYLTLLLLLVSCTKKEFDRRWISSAITCVGQIECFKKVDSILAESNVDNLPATLSMDNLPDADSVISFHDYSDINENATILVLDQFHVPQPGKYLLRLGSDDGFRVFVNGKETDRRIIGRSLKPDSEWIEVNLNEGRNTILYQVNQQDGSWGLYYKIDNNYDLEALLDSKIFEIYKDLSEACILDSASTSLELKKDPRQHRDSFHEINFKWINPFDNLVLFDSTYLANDAPQEIPLPSKMKSPLLFEYSILDNDTIIYSETVPIFNNTSLRNYIKQAKQQLSKVNDSRLWESGLEHLFAKELGLKAERAYSTRMKSEFLWDVLKRTGKIQYAVGGPRTFVFNGALARSYVPYNVSEKVPAVLVLHVEFSDSIHHYLESHPGSSHALMTRWNSYAQEYGVKLTFPFIVERSTDKNTYEVLASFSEQYSDSFYVAAWSKSVAVFLDAIDSQAFPIKKTGFISPWLVDAPTERFLIINNIHKYNPQINFQIWHGMDDTDVPEYIIENWVESFHEQNLNVDYYTIPHSTHWNYWKEPEEEYYPLLR